MIDPRLEITFGLGGDAAPLLGEGWSFPEQGFVWTIGTRSRVRLPVPAAADDLVLELKVHGFCVPAELPSQLLTVIADGATLGTAAVSETVTIAFAVPGDVTVRGFIDVTLEHPDATSPAALGIGEDLRPLAIAVFAMRLWRTQRLPLNLATAAPIMAVASERDATLVAACGLLPADLMMRFESIGQNCEFGLVQRAVQSEPLSLLRFAGIELWSLMRGLETGFDGIHDPMHFKLTTGVMDGRPEYMIFATRHWVRFHTGIFISDMPNVTAVVERARNYLEFLQRRFVETLSAGNRIFVLQHPEVMDATHALPVLSRLCAYGPNSLLYVTESETMAPGTVRQEAGGLYHGFTDVLPPPDEPDRINVDAWLSLCANTLQLMGA